MVDAPPSRRHKAEHTWMLDHDEVGLIQSDFIVIDSNSLERDLSGKPVSTFPHPALTTLHVFGSTCGTKLAKALWPRKNLVP
jgi:hypothetical protein